MLTSFRSGPCGVGAWHVDGIMKTRWQRARDVEAWFLRRRFDTAVGRQSMLPVHYATQAAPHRHHKSYPL